MKINDTIKILRLHNDWRRSGEGEQNQGSLQFGQALDAAIAQLSEHRAMQMKIESLEFRIKQLESLVQSYKDKYYDLKNEATDLNQVFERAADYVKEAEIKSSRVGRAFWVSKEDRE